jgi:hypothetical protein
MHARNDLHRLELQRSYKSKLSVRYVIDRYVIDKTDTAVMELLPPSLSMSLLPDHHTPLGNKYYNARQPNRSL